MVLESFLVHYILFMQNYLIFYDIIQQRVIALYFYFKYILMIYFLTKNKFC